jgi:murein DD-endopeptidase MepM/ murein hydrolase activator NlpD
MIRLTNQQTERVLATIRSSVKTSFKVRNELFDHWCCYIEAAMSDGSTFKQGFSDMKRHFDIKEARAIEESYLAYQPGQPWLTTVRRVGSMAAMLVFLIVAGVDAQKRPDISPLLDSYAITSPFGDRIHPISNREVHHNGIDLKAPMSTPVRATADGTIKLIKNDDEGHGLHIIIQHSEGYETLYGNLSLCKVTQGQTIIKGEIIGASGNSGTSTAPHLHYEIRHDQKHVDPEVYISR